MTLEEMLAKPGTYEVTTPAMSAKYEFVRVEVAEDLVCYQLTPNLVRDGVLSREGWATETIVLGEFPHG